MKRNASLWKTRALAYQSTSPMKGCVDWRLPLLAVFHPNWEWGIRGTLAWFVRWGALPARRLEHLVTQTSTRQLWMYHATSDGDASKTLMVKTLIWSRAWAWKW